MLTLAGIDLLGSDEDGQVDQFINQYINPSEFMPWLRKTWPGFGTQHISWPVGSMSEPAFKLNRFRFPTGASRWAYGHFLCNSDAVIAISKSAYTQNGAYNQIPLVIGNPESNSPDGLSLGTIISGETVTVNVFMLPPTPLSGIRGLSGKIQSLYLLTIVDQRYFWWWRYLNKTIDLTTKWQDLITAIETALGLSSPITNLPSGPVAIDTAYLQPSIEMFQLPYEPIPIILDAVAFNLGARVVVGYDGKVHIVPYSNSLQVLNADMNSDVGQKRVVLSGGQRFADPI